MHEPGQATVTAAELGAAIKADAFILHWQPIMDVHTGAFTSFEALLRWERRGVQVPPLVVVAAAEASGQIEVLDSYVALKAAREAVTWGGGQGAAINVSASQFLTGRVIGLVTRALELSGLEPRRLHVELTEGILLDDPDGAVSTLGELKSLGVVVTLDDFGSVYSSLSYLHRLEFDRIKLDRHFLMKCPASGRSRAIVSAILGLGRALGHPVVVEGVERQEQMDFLISEGCDEVQGRLLGWPQPMDSYAAHMVPVPAPIP